MSTRSEIIELEERLRQAELGPDPAFFEEHLADDAVFVGQNGQPSLSKSRVVEAHQPGPGPIFTRVEMRDMQFVAHGPDAAVVTCTGTYEGPKGSVTLAFMRVWFRRDGRWQIVAVSMSN